MKQFGSNTEISRPYAPRSPRPGGSFQNRFPYKAAEWHPTKNKPYRPSDVSWGSGFRAWWICGKCHHEYRMRVNHRANGHGCRSCANEIIRQLRLEPTKGEAFGDKHPELVPHWDPVRNGPLTPYDVKPRSTYLAHWICPTCKKPHRCVVHARPRIRGCFSCGRKTGGDKLAATVRSKSLGCRHPEKVKFWDYAKNAPITPYDVKPQSGRKFYWRCPRGHEWRARVQDVATGRGCARCSTKISAPQKRLYAELSLVFPDAILRHRIDGIECDIFLPSIKTAVEYDGWYYHRNRRRKDVRNTLRLQRIGIRMIRVREHPLGRITNSDVLAKPLTNPRQSECEMCQMVFKKLRCLLKRSESPTSCKRKVDDYIRQRRIQNQSLYSALLADKTSPLPGESLADLHPSIAREFDEERNGGLTAREIGSSSGRRFHWRCIKGHVWMTTVDHRIAGQRCPYCSGRSAHVDHCLAVKSPEIARLWHPTKNGGLTSYDVTPASGKRVWFLCEVCGWEWRAIIANRQKGQGCPCCAGHVLTDKNRLSKVKPELVAEWHPTKNRLGPDRVFAYSNAHAWWRCPKHGSVFYQRIDYRSRGHTGCTKCSSAKMSIARTTHSRRNCASPSQICD